MRLVHKRHLTGTHALDRVSAYAELAAELERFRRMPYGELARRVGGPPVERSVETADGPLTIEVSFGRAVTGKEGVRVSATAYGPSWWRLDRLEETASVSPPTTAPDL
jgi:hypothetical protein